MKKIADSLEKVIFVIFSIMFLGILLIDICFQYVDFYRRKQFMIWNVILVPVIIVLFLCMCRFYRKKKDAFLKFADGFERKILVASLILCGLQILICFNIYFMTGWDSGIITANADFVAKGQISELWNWYYAKCPNNSLLTGIYAIVFWVCEHIGIPSSLVRLLIVFGQCMLSTWTAYLLYKCARKIFREKTIPVICWGIYVILQGLSPWLVIPYSDSTCLFMPILLLWMYLTLEDSKWKYVKCVLMGVIAYLGYQMKPMVLIVLLAILIVECLENIKNREQIKKWSTIGIICISLLGTFGVSKVVNLEKAMGFQIEEGKVFGLTHYFMMGLNEEHSGVYIQEDADFSLEINGNAKRTRENLRVAKERIEDYGCIGLLKHTIRKTMVNFNDGTFAWGQEGDFYGIKYNVPNNPFKTFFREFYYDNGRFHKAFESIVQFVWMLVLVGVACNCVRIKDVKKGYTKNELVLAVSLIGITLFVMLFEARARYLYTFVPIFILASAGGYSSLFQIIRQICCRSIAKSGEVNDHE